LIYQPIINIAEIFARKDVKNIIISPGSRSAPLTLAFARHPEIKTKVIPDERSAAFIGLGMALTSERPVGLICTSGSAALNYYPAIAEAYFQKIPLLVLTADRPREWIGQQDGQTIFQNEIFSRHIKKSYELPSDFDHKDAVWYSERIISEAINLANEEPKGPVHINIPLREPLYPTSKEEIKYEEQVKVVSVSGFNLQPSEIEVESFLNALLTTDKALIVSGQAWWKAEDKQLLDAFTKSTNIPIIGDVLSNLHSIDSVINIADVFLTGKKDDELRLLQPDLLITFGDSVISKNIKLFLRKCKPKEHWHIQEAGVYPDTFQSVTKIIRLKPVVFFNALLTALKKKAVNNPLVGNYQDLWLKENASATVVLKDFFSTKAFSEFEAVKNVIEELPENCLLHLSNSMPVRYANYIGLKGKGRVTVYANRGTSGIDGCSSTAVGTAFTVDKPVVLLTGDMAFFYDRNAFWHNYPLPNLRVIVLNNHGGGIFRLIDGPADLPEREEYFETFQKLTAENTAKDFNLDYYFCRERVELESTLKTFFKPSQKGRILEIETDKSINRQVFNDFKSFFKNRN